MGTQSSECVSHYFDQKQIQTVVNTIKVVVTDKYNFYNMPLVSILDIIWLHYHLKLVQVVGTLRLF